MMAADYILIFKGSNIEAGRIIYDLKEIGIQPITKDQQTSAARSGFAIPALGDEIQVLVHKDEYERAKEVL